MSTIKNLFIDPSLHLTSSTTAIGQRSHRLVNNDLFFGVELELEGCTHPLPSHGGMTLVGPLALQHSITAHADGSLRNGGIELVTKPIRGLELTTQVDYICHIAKEMKWTPSNRAGLHIHVNVQGLTVEQWAELLKIYVLIEPCFFEAIGRERKGSIYCKSWYQHGDPSDLRRTIGAMSQGQWHQQKSRYLGLNTNSTGKYGTLEFRHKNSTTDAQEIINWINLIAKWYNYSIGQKMTAEMVKNLKPEDLVQAVFGNTQLMSPEFPSYFYHGCVPLWFDLFDKERPVINTRSWSRSKANGHRGYSSFIARRPPPAPGIFKQIMADQPDNIPEWTNDLPISTTHYWAMINGHHCRIYFNKPTRLPDHDRTPNHPQTWTSPTGRLWVADHGRPDLYMSATNHDDQLNGAQGLVVYTYSSRIPENS